MTFKFSSYWKTWNRVLSTDHHHGPFVEVNLTPHIDDWERDVKPIRIRAHRTRLRKDDLIVDTLPPEIIAKMGEFFT